MPDNQNFINNLPAISTGVGAVGSIIAPIAQWAQNKQNRKYQLRDRDYNNWYNSPEQQMERLKAGGLNPNLVYGSGNAITPAVNSGSNERPAPQTDTTDIQRALYQWQDYAIKELKANQLEKLAKLATENTLLAREKTEAAARGNRMGESLFDSQLDMYNERLRNQRLQNTGQAYENQLKLQEWQIKDIMRQPNLDKTLAEIESIKARTLVYPHQIDLMHEQMNNLRSTQEYRNLQTDQLNMVKDDLHQLIIYDQKLKQGAITQQQAETERLRIETNWKSAGLSPTFISDIIGTVVGGSMRK
jgi:hypothetical protein